LPQCTMLLLEFRLDNRAMTGAAQGLALPPQTAPVD